MNKPKFIFKVALLLFALSSINVLAQTENNKTPTAEPCYEVVLQLLTASNEASGKNDAAPPALAGIVRRLKTLYAFSDYRLTTTFLQRTANNVEYKSLISDFNTSADKNAPVFSEWSLRNLRALPDLQGRETIQIDNFRFGARIPITVQTVKVEDEKSPSVISYEAIGINNSRFSLRENEPTIVGSLATSKTDELVFLILTVKPVE